MDTAEWLGYEVVDVEGEAVVRQRVNARGRWVEREARATAAEMKLYDAVRALVLVARASHEPLMQQVRQLAADRYVERPPGTSGYYRIHGEQNAFAMVVQLLETGEVPS